MSWLTVNHAFMIHIGSKKDKLHHHSQDQRAVDFEIGAVTNPHLHAFFQMLGSDTCTSLVGIVPTYIDTNVFKNTQVYKYRCTFPLIGTACALFLTTPHPALGDVFFRTHFNVTVAFITGKSSSLSYSRRTFFYYQIIFKLLIFCNLS